MLTPGSRGALRNSKASVSAASLPPRGNQAFLPRFTQAHPKGKALWEQLRKLHLFTQSQGQHQLLPEQKPAARAQRGSFNTHGSPCQGSSTDWQKGLGPLPRHPPFLFFGV